MSQIFYDHLVILEKVEIELSSQKLSSKEKAEINQLIEESIHFRVMTRILDHLPREHHEEFLKLFQYEPHSQRLLPFLKEKVSDIEEKIKEEISLLEQELLKDIESFKFSPKRLRKKK